jgi:hypothetical protein
MTWRIYEYVWVDDMTNDMINFRWPSMCIILFKSLQSIMIRFTHLITHLITLRNSKPTQDNMTTSTNNILQPPSQATSTPVQVFDGPITRSRAKKLQQEVHALLSENHFNVNENYILPKLCTLLLLRCTTEDDKKTPRVNQRGGSRSSQSSMTEPSERISHHFWLPKAMKAHEDLLESLSSLVSNATCADQFGVFFWVADLF